MGLSLSPSVSQHTRVRLHTHAHTHSITCTHTRTHAHTHTAPHSSCHPYFPLSLPLLSDDDDDDDDDDETAELMRELDRIKKERAEEAARVEAQKRALEEKQAKEAALAGNPLLLGALGAAPGGAGGAVIKRRCVRNVGGWVRCPGQRQVVFVCVRVCMRVCVCVCTSGY